MQKPEEDMGTAREIAEFFYGGDAILTKEQLLVRNIDFMRRCAEAKLADKEAIRGGQWALNLSDEDRRELLSLIFKHEDWSKETDPKGTHGNGVVLFKGNYVVWAIREFDLTPAGMLMASPPRELCLLVKHSSEI